MELIGSTSTSTSTNLNHHKKNEIPDGFDDVISSAIRQGTTGFGLAAVLAVSICMATISLVLIIQYQYEDEGRDRDEYSANNRVPVWADLLQSQIQILQNLVHASLLGGAGCVAAFRGDVVWLYFARNCCFYFGLAAVSYFVVGITNGTTTTTISSSSVLLVMSAWLGLASMAAIGRLESVRNHVQRLLRLSRCNKSTPSIGDNDATDHYPKYIPSTRLQISLTSLILRLVDVLQVVWIVYVVLMTAHAIMDTDDGHDDGNGNDDGNGHCYNSNAITTTIGLLEASYRLGAHQAFLLSLLMLVATFPGHPACVGGAIICSGWRLVLAVAYLVGVSLDNLMADNDNAVWTTRDTWSLVATMVEVALMAPILVAALLLMRENRQDDDDAYDDNDDCCSKQRNKNGSAPTYSRIAVADDDETDEVEENDDDTEKLESMSVHEEPSSVVGQRIQCLSMRQISKSNHFSSRQRLGALVMWMSSVCLLCGMTVECLILLTSTHMNANDVYQWGMHVCAMYLFCTHMSVSSPEVYRRARTLLGIACPAGSVVAGWQLWVLFKTTNMSSNDDDELWMGKDTTSLAWLAYGIFFWRALCGIGQSVGLAILPNTQPVNDDETFVQDNGASPELRNRLTKARFVLFKLYLPVLFFNIVWEAYSYSYSQPLISPSTPGCVQDYYLLAKAWPGLGTCFHFGGLLVIFANDAIAISTNANPNGPSYPPSLAIATLFSIHLSILLFVNLCWRSIMTTRATTTAVETHLQILPLLWMLTSLALGISLTRIRKWKISEA